MYSCEMDGSPSCSIIPDGIVVASDSLISF